MRFTFLFSILFFISGVQCQTSTDIQKLISASQNSDILRHAQWSLYAQDAQSGQLLIDYNSDKSLAPASCLKLFTSATALEILGPDFQFKTELYYSGTIDKHGTLNGDIYIRGGGDPTLGSDLLDGALPLNDLMQNWTNVLKKIGIQKIDGSILADGRLFDPVTVPDNWMWVDLGNYYGAGVSALTIHDNLYYLYFKPGKKIGSPAKVLRTEPQLINLQFDNQMRTGKVGSGDNGYIFRAPNANTATLRGTIPAGVKEFSIKGSLPQPALFTVQYLDNYLEDNGINCSENPASVEHDVDYTKLTRFHTTVSPPLREVIFMLNKRSVNLYAEQLLLYLAIQKNGSGNFSNGLEMMMEFLEQNNINTSGIHLEDGSGLSPKNLITTRALVELLSIMYQKDNFAVFNHSLSLAGDPEDIGHFKTFGMNTIIEKKCRIKSGLIQGVRSHSGYLTTKSGRLIAFSFIANNFTERYRKIDNIHKNLLILLAQNY